MTLKTIETTFDIINVLIELDGARVTELAERMDRPTSTIHDYLKALNEGGYVVKEGQTYRVSSRFLYFGQRARNQRKIFDAARGQIESLAAETGEYASLTVEEQGYGILLYTVQGEKAVDIDTPDGVRTKLHATAMGKCVLANLSQERVEAIIEDHGLDERTPHTTTDREALLAELKEVREQGYAIDEEEQFEGMQGVGAPITGMSGTLRGAVGVYGPIGRTGNPNAKERIREAVSEAVNVIEVSLKYPSDYP
jgi:DNA-binding IclR family transcriptional regulator